MIDRYSRPHLKAIWEPSRKYQTWLQVELLACEALAKKGLIPPSAVRQIRAKARVNPARIEALERVLAVLRDRAWEHRDTLMIGRSHGIHGEPITFGVKLAIWYDETKRHRERFRAARDGIACGKVSGAMGDRKS